MSKYRVKLGEEILEVEGLAGLIELVSQGRLQPEDPVLLPSTGRWHYARSIRQLRAYFPGTEPPPPPGDETTGKALPSSPPPKPEPEGAQVLSLRRGRWTPDGKGVEVPVYAYEIDAEPPRPLRLTVVIAAALIALPAVWIYTRGYSSYLDDYTANVAIAAPNPTQPPINRAATAATSRPPTLVSRPTATPTPARTATPRPLPAFDATAVRSKVATLSVTAVAKPDQLGAAMRRDLTHLAVPVHDAVLLAGKGARNEAVPFVLRVEYVPTDKTDAAARAKARFAIVVLAGRRAQELHLKLSDVRVRTTHGKKFTEVDVPADLVQRAWSGEASGDDVSALFAGK